MALQLLFPRLVEHKPLVLLLLGVMDGGYLRLTGIYTDRSPSVNPSNGGDSLFQPALARSWNVYSTISILKR